jgi:protein-tyrosine phosphatase
MVAYGVTTVIDLRTQAELDGAAPDPRFPWLGADASRPPGVTCVHISLVEEVRRKIAATGVGRYIEIVDERQHAFGSVFNTIAEADGAVLFHCFAGKDRTGLVAAMLLEMAGVAREHIAADYCETDRQLARQYEIWLDEASPEVRDEIRADLCCPADRILGTLDHVDRTWGGVAGYLEGAGVSPANLDRVSSLLD